MSDDTRLTIRIAGRVQGVGMRWWVAGRARDLGLRGAAINLDDGSVEVVAQGPRAACDALLAAFDDDPPGRVGSLDRRWGEPTDEPAGFRTS